MTAVLQRMALQDEIKASLSKTDLIHSQEEGMAPSTKQIASSTPIEKGTSFDSSSRHPPHPHTENSHSCDTCSNWTEPALIVFRPEVPAQGPGCIS